LVKIQIKKRPSLLVPSALIMMCACKNNGFSTSIFWCEAKQTLINNIATVMSRRLLQHHQQRKQKWQQGSDK